MNHYFNLLLKKVNQLDKLIKIFLKKYGKKFNDSQTSNT